MTACPVWKTEVGKRSAWLAVPAHPKFRLKLLRNGSLYSDAILIKLFDLLSASEHMIIKIIQLHLIVQATTQLGHLQVSISHDMS